MFSKECGIHKYNAEYHIWALFTLYWIILSLNRVLSANRGILSNVNWEPHFIFEKQCEKLNPQIIFVLWKWLFHHVIPSRNIMTRHNLCLFVSPREPTCSAFKHWDDSVEWLDIQRAFTFCTAHASLFPPTSALFSSKRLSTSRAWLPSQSRTEGLTGADGRVTTEPGPLSDRENIKILSQLDEKHISSNS